MVERVLLDGGFAVISAAGDRCRGRSAAAAAVEVAVTPTTCGAMGLPSSRA